MAFEKSVFMKKDLFNLYNYESRLRRIFLNFQLTDAFNGWLLPFGYIGCYIHSSGSIWWTLYFLIPGLFWLYFVKS